MFVATVEIRLQDAAGAPQDVTAVALSDAAGTYGIWDLTGQQVAIPAGTPLVRQAAGAYRYQHALATGRVYRYALEIQQGTRRLFLRGYLCPAAQEALLAASWPESLSEDELPSSSQWARLVREDSRARFALGHGPSHRLRVRVLAAEGVTRYLFGHQQRTIAAVGTQLEEFAFVAAPRDLTVYPLDAPNLAQAPAYYRRSYLDVVLPNPDVAERAWTAIKAEVDVLLAARARLVRLGVTP